MIQSLLIANRGEIACRIIRTARRMGIRTVAVYSDADARALHVRQADEAVHIGPSPARESYLAGDKIIAAAQATGAEAIHPGYGFLSENAGFAQSVIDAGLIWIGPRPASIVAMGLKDTAKALMAAAGVPVTPGYLGENQDAGQLANEAAKIGFPVLIKAVAGGGGKGMRLVERAEDFADALVSCQREASASFDNAHVLIEKYVVSPRHIEVQVFGDSHGNLVHLFERDCSLQRRHQKVIEEAPAPGMDEATRAAICGAAVRAAQAVSYEGAGTIEFIADASEGLRADRIWFMEMNTRLQVEHPVTEEITGVDLVEWQLRVASGEPLPRQQEELAINGWAIEARLYAEDPAKGFLPSVGPLTYFELPPASIKPGRSSRIETGYSKGSEVSPFYDPMIAKLIVHARSREEAIRRLGLDCSFVTCWPVKTNAEFLRRITQDERFLSGKVDTGLLSDRAGTIVPGGVPTAHALEALSQHILEPWRQATSPWTRKDAFRVNPAGGRVTHQFSLNGDQIAYVAGSSTTAGRSATNVDEGYLLRDLGSTYVLTDWDERGGSHHSAHDGDILSPMPGRIIAVEVACGQVVIKGQKLLTLEAMKMEHTLTAPFDGVVAELSAAPGAQVQVETVLARIKPAE